MSQSTSSGWVVYEVPTRGVVETARAVCEQREWDAMELAKPGRYLLVQAGIANEGEAERVARGTAGEVPARKTAKKPTWFQAAITSRATGSPE